MSRISYNDYVQNLALDCKLHPKRFWSFVKSKRKQQRLNSFCYGDQIHTIPVEIASAFNRYFESNFSQQQSPYQPPKDHGRCEAHPGITPLQNLHVNQGDVLKAIKNLNSSKPPGLDGISPKILQFAGPLLPPYWHVYLTSVSLQVQFPVAGSWQISFLYTNKVINP